jgi:Tfp pilus assembly protein PilF
MRRALTRWLLVVVCGAAVLAFLPTLDAGFVNWDDDTNLLRNEGFRGLGLAQLRWMWTTTLMGHYIPLTWMTLGLNFALGGMSPWGYHLVNVLLHAATAGAFFLVGRRLLAAGFAAAADGGAFERAPAEVPSEHGRDRRHRAPDISWGSLAGDTAPGASSTASAGDGAIALGAAVAALVFAIHPLRAESVAWVTERRDVLSGLFYLLAVWAYLRGAERGGVIERRWRAWSLLAFAAGLLSKSIVMTLPATLLLLDIYPLRRLGLGWRALVREKAPYAAVAALGAIVALAAVHRGATVTPLEEHGFGARVALVAYSLWFYPWKMLWPAGLTPLYELPVEVSLASGRFLLPVVGVIAVTGALLAVARRWPAGLAAWVYSAIALAPVAGVIHAGHQLAHDRYSYLSGLGFALLAGSGVTWLARAWGRGGISTAVTAVAAAGVVLAVVGLGVGAREQARIWRDSESLWGHAVTVDPECVLCWNRLGDAAMQRGDAGAAEARFRKAVALRPARGASHANLGWALSALGRDAEAEVAFKEAMRLAPGLVDGPANLGALYARQGRTAEAIPLLRQALALDRRFPGLRANLGAALKNEGARLAREGGTAEAIPLFREAVIFLDGDADSHRNLGQALLEGGRIAEAVPPLERAVALAPENAPARYWLARAYLAAGDTPRAAREVEALRRLDPAAAARLADAAGKAAPR